MRIRGNNITIGVTVLNHSLLIQSDNKACGTTSLCTTGCIATTDSTIGCLTDHKTICAAAFSVAINYTQVVNSSTITKTNHAIIIQLLWIWHIRSIDSVLSTIEITKELMIRFTYGLPDIGRYTI